MPAADASDSSRKHTFESTFETTTAAEQYAAAVVQQTGQIARLPTFTEYMDEVCPKNAKSGGNGSLEAEEGDMDDET